MAKRKNRKEKQKVGWLLKMCKHWKCQKIFFKGVDKSNISREHVLNEDQVSDNF